jgi:cation-transporting ATPase 13A1
MAWQVNLSDDVREITLYRPLPVYLHGYLVPFLAVYGAVYLGWWQAYGLTEHWEALLISLAAVAVLNVLSVLSCVWSVHFRAFLTCKKVNSLDQARVVKVVPTPNNGFSELVPLVKQKHKVTREPLTWFMFQKTKYTLGCEGLFQPLQFPVNKTFHDYHTWQGYGEDSEVAAVRTTYGKNRSLFSSIPSGAPLMTPEMRAPL